MPVDAPAVTSSAPVVPPVAPPPPANPAAAKPKGDAAPPPADKPADAAPPPADGKGAPDPKAAAATAGRKPAHEAFLTAEFPADDPLWKGGHTIDQSFEELLEVTSEPGRKFLANVRSDYSRKTAELAREREDNRKALATERRALADERQQLARLSTPEFKAHLQELADKAKGADPFTAEGQQAIAEAKAVALYQKMIAPIQEQVETEARRSQYRAYIAANEDFQQPAVRVGVMKLLEAKPHLTLEEAHDLYRGQRAREEATRLRTVVSEGDAERARTLALTGSGGLTNTDTAAEPEFRSAVDAERWLRARGMK